MKYLHSHVLLLILLNSFFSYMDMNSVEFNLGEALKVIVNQVMTLSHGRQVEVMCDLPAEVSSMYLFGDTLRLQQVLSDVLATAILFTPAFEGSSVLFKVIPRKECIGTKVHVVHIEFRYFFFLSFFFYFLYIYFTFFLVLFFFLGGVGCVGGLWVGGWSVEQDLYVPFI